MTGTDKRRFTDTTRDIVRDEIRAAVDRAVIEMGVDPAVVLEILKDVTSDEEQFQLDLQ